MAKLLSKKSMHSQLALIVGISVLGQLTQMPSSLASCDESYARELGQLKQSAQGKTGDGMLGVGGGAMMAGTALVTVGAATLAAPAGLAIAGAGLIVNRHRDSMQAMWNHIWDSRKMVADADAMNAISGSTTEVPALRSKLIVTENNSAMVREYESFTNLYKFLNSILKNSEVQSLRPDLKISDLARVVADLDTQNAFCFEDPNDPAGQSDGHRIILEALNATQSVQKSVESKKASLIAKGKPEIAERIGKLPIAQSAERSMYIIEAAGPFVCEKAYSDFTKGGASGVTAERLISQSGQATLPKKMSEFAQHHDNSVFAASVVISTAYKVKNLVSLSPQDLRSANRMWLKAEIDSSGLFDTWMHDRMLAKNKELESIHPHLTDAELVNAIVSLDQKGAFCADARNPEDQDQMRASILAELGATGEASKQRANIEKDQAKFKISWPN